MPAWSRRAAPISSTWGPDQVRLRHNDVRSAVRWAVLVVLLLAAFEAACGWVAPTLLPGSGDGISLSVAVPLGIAGLAGLGGFVFAIGLARRFKLPWLAVPTAVLMVVVSIFGLRAIDATVEGPGYLDASPAPIVPAATIAAMLSNPTKYGGCTWLTGSTPGFVPPPYQRCVSDFHAHDGQLAGLVTFINNPGTDHANGFVFSTVALGTLPNLCVRPVDAHWWAVLSENYLNSPTTCPYPYSPGPMGSRGSVSAPGG